MVIDRRALLGMVVRAAVLWLGVRLVALMTVSFAGAGDPVAAATAATTDGTAATRLIAGSIVITAVTILTLADVRALHERAFRANLGIGLGSIAGLSAVTAALLETGFALAFRALS
jgi:hypothetical protein